MKEREAVLEAEAIAQLFTRDGQYLCARWGRAVAPVIFGLDDDSLAVFRDVTRAVIAALQKKVVLAGAYRGAHSNARKATL